MLLDDTSEIGISNILGIPISSKSLLTPSPNISLSNTSLSNTSSSNTSSSNFDIETRKFQVLYTKANILLKTYLEYIKKCKL